jgi:dimethylhistidine N-methyltransferase
LRTAAIRFYDEHPGTADLRKEVLAGFARNPKSVPPKFFYDERGSELFDRICGLPEYYPTRAEIGILKRNAREIAALAGHECMLVELGSGASKKVRLLLEALRPQVYMGVDISKEFLLSSTRKLANDYPWLEVHATCADFSQGLALPHCPADAKTLAFFPGSSIGNFDPDEALVFLTSLRETLLPDGALLIGVDLKKAPAILNAAYNDSQGVTAEFNLNLLRRIERELDIDVDVSSFDHRAFYNETEGRVEMHLVSRRRQQLRLNGAQFEFEEGESIHTENSYKYSIEEFHALARQAGYKPETFWTDTEQLFSVHYLTVAR